jgi:hypothetical protein
MRKLWALKVWGLQIEKKKINMFCKYESFFLQPIIFLFQLQNKHLGNESKTFEPFEPSMQVRF